MFSSLRMAYRTMFSQEEVRIMMLGLDAAGKTTCLYKLKLGEIVTTIPTIGMNVEQVDHKNFSVTAFDVGGRTKIRPLYKHYFQTANAIVWLVDSNDRDRVEESQDELFRTLDMFEETEAAVPVLILANKQDLPNAMSVAEVADKMRVADITRLKNNNNRNNNGSKNNNNTNKTSCYDLHIQPVCVTSGDGLLKGLDWLTDTLAAQKGKMKEQSSSTSSTSMLKWLSSWVLPAVDKSEIPMASAAIID